ncbi:uncharacterized protein LOC143211466 isoform X2 [Lasioglossum baleicum]|uniref:uncharacterized protein LOC143211466 isoform X2 n=1 Tax=Lasioglossum baleicum TaxID=434251 RepID=UPI003FCD2361
MFDSLRRHLKVSYYKIRKSLYISNFVTLIWPYTFIVSALGFFPYDTHLSSYKLAKMSYIGSVIKMINITLLCPFMLYTKFTKWAWDESNTSLHWIGIYIFGIVGLWATFVSSRSKLHLLRMVSTASRVLSPEELCRTAKWMYAIDILKVCLFLSYIYDFKGGLWTIVLYMLSFYIFFVAMVITTLFINCLYVLNMCFRKINTSLEKLKTSLATDEPHLLRRVYHSQNNPALISELKTLRRQHVEFSSIIDASNETFGLEIIVIIALSIMDITFNLYSYLIHNTVDGKIVHVWSIKIEYLTYDCLALIGLALVCQKVKDQVKNIGINIHRILVISFDEQVSTELEQFSMQVLQQNRAITAKGLALDVTLLTKIVGIVTTYLLILIQFLLMKTC